MPTSKAQQQAVVRYKAKNYSRIPLDVPKEYHEYLKARAKQDGQSVNAWIKQAIDERAENVAENIPPEVITNLKQWLLEHGHNMDEVMDCIIYLGNQ